MQLAMIGLGRMGGNMAERLMRGGHDVVVFDRSQETVQRYVDDGATAAADLGDVVARLAAPRVIWIMVPAGDPVDATIDALLPSLGAGDVLVEGGNSNFHDSQRRAARAAERGVHFVDSGTSGGVWGLENGYCLMVGGDDDAVRLVEPAFLTLAPPDGYAHVGASGAGHFVKMVHNGIEYALMQGYAEGFELMNASEFELDLEQVAGIWRHGSVVRSWLLDLLHDAFGEEGADLAGIAGWVDDSGEGRWTVQEAIDARVPVPAIALSLFARFSSRQDESFAAKVNAALRAQFGGHAVRKT